MYILARISPSHITKRKKNDGMDDLCCNAMQINTHVYVHACSGTVAGIYVGVEYRIEKIRGHRDWVGIHSFVYLFVICIEERGSQNI